MRNRLVLGLAACAVVWTSMVASARAEEQANRNDTLAASEMIFLSSKLGDFDVFNWDNTDTKLGNLDNLIINAHSGSVLYGILDTGVGGKQIAIPWNAFRLQKNVNTGNAWLLLKKTENELASAPTFDKDNMPNFMDSNWQKTVHDFFGVRTVARPVEGNKEGQLTTSEMIFRSNRLADLHVFNRDNKDSKLGNLDNLVINAHSGRVLYGVLDTGVGGKMIPVPWNAFKLEKAADKDQHWLTLNKSQEDLKNAPTIDTNNLPNFTEEKWQKSVNEFFGMQTAARSVENR